LEVEEWVLVVPVAQGEMAGAELEVAETVLGEAKDLAAVRECGAAVVPERGREPQALEAVAATDRGM
jgi:hypothetical protein